MLDWFVGTGMSTTTMHSYHAWVCRLGRGPQRPNISHTIPSNALLFVLFACWPIAACGSSPERLTLAGTPVATKESCSLDVPTYEAVTKPLLNHYCSQCHRAGGVAGEEHNFEQFETLFAQRRRLEGVLRNEAMPPRSVPLPTHSERAAMIRWATCGAPRS